MVCLILKPRWFLWTSVRWEPCDCRAGLDRARIVDALQPSSITFYKTSLRRLWWQGELEASVLDGQPVSNDNPDICEQMVRLDWILKSASLPQQTQRWSLAGRALEGSVLALFGASLSQSSIKSSGLVQICVLGFQRTVDHIHNTHQCFQGLTWAVFYCDRPHPSCGWPGTCCFCQQMRTSFTPDVSYVLFIAPSLT